MLSRSAWSGQAEVRGGDGGGRDSDPNYSPLIGVSSIHHYDPWIGILHYDSWGGILHYESWGGILHYDSWGNIHHYDSWDGILHYDPQVFSRTRKPLISIVTLSVCGRAKGHSSGVQLTSCQLVRSRTRGLPGRLCMTTLSDTTLRGDITEGYAGTTATAAAGRGWGVNT